MAEEAQAQEPNVPAEPAQVEEPQEPTSATSPEINTDEILTELQTMGVANAMDLQNMHTASQQVGNLANKLGEKNQEVDQLKTEIATLKGQVGSNDFDPYTQPQQQTTGLSKNDIKNAFRELNAEQQTAHKAYLQEWGTVQSDPRYGMAKDVFEKHVQTPNIQMRLSAGQTTIKDEYNRVVITILEKLAGHKANENLAQVQQPAAQQATNVNAPHIESSASQSTPTPDADTEKTQKVKDMTKPENWGGTTTDLKKLVDTMLPADDPLWKR